MRAWPNKGREGGETCLSFSELKFKLNGNPFHRTDNYVLANGFKVALATKLHSQKYYLARDKAENDNKIAKEWLSGLNPTALRCSGAQSPRTTIEVILSLLLILYTTIDLFITYNYTSHNTITGKAQ